MLRLFTSFTHRALFARNWRRIGTTWANLLIETTLFVLIPLMIGRAIDDLLAGGVARLGDLCILLAALLIVSVLRRVYDTRAYGSIRVALGNQLNRRYPRLPVSARTA